MDDEMVWSELVWLIVWSGLVYLFKISNYLLEINELINIDIELWCKKLQQ